MVLWQHQTKLAVSGQCARAAQQGRAQARGEFACTTGAEFQALAASPFHSGLLQVFSNTSLEHTLHGALRSSPSRPRLLLFLGEVVVVYLCLLTSTKLPDGISMLCRETEAFYYRCHVDPIHLHSQKWSEAFAHCIGKECSAPSRDPEGLLWAIVAL